MDYHSKCNTQNLKKVLNHLQIISNFNYDDGKFVKFQPDNAGGWHVYEVANPSQKTPTDVLRQMKDNGEITKAEYRKSIKNKQRE